MKQEGHVGVLEVTTMLLISAIYAAEGRVSDVKTLKKEDMVYPLPPLKEIEATLLDPEKAREEFAESHDVVQEEELQDDV
jgi:hypothetical protein